MKKLICVLLAAVLLFSLAACGKTASPSDDPVSELTPDCGEEPVNVFGINGHKLSEYRIVYRKTNVPSQYLFVARELQSLVAEKTGYTPDIYAEDEKLPAQETELLVGMCEGREVCDDYFYEIYNERGDYYLAVKGASVIFAANNAGGAYLAVKEFAKLIDKGGELKDMKQKGTGEITTVACVGGSITEGSNSDDSNKNYPTYLQEMLGPEYFVMNYGISGYSVVSTDQFAYCKTAQYKQSLSLAPDIVIFALGTNDCNPTSNQPYKAWEGTDRAQKFEQSVKELLDSYKALPSNPKIYLCLPCSLTKVPGDQWNADEWSARIEKYALPILQSVAREYELPVIDLWTWSRSHPEVFKDGLHPKDESYKEYALAVYNAMTEGKRGE
ncbi:MAG: hypothetical protein IJQ53_04135 [Clostridia bacterium]|nr:hypothetical protein [Clostridia bacterium]